MAASGSLKFAAFMAGPIGRLARIVAGLVLIVIGLTSGGTGGIVLALIGLVPLAMGAMNRCLFSLLIGAAWRGQEALDATA
ncbi:MAG: DUF2892 domain-containing protein [Acidimicrobiia bacterium]|nr:DUF2892 domain-containing protein [Acidimicrobiia bacterium]MDH5520071.1 DUF2892 domain-containing protein [Acidimicrobiia bacterium]